MLTPGRTPFPRAATRATSTRVKKRAIAISVGLGAILLVWVVVLLSDSGEQPAPAQPSLEAAEPAPEEPAAEQAAPSVEPTEAEAEAPSQQRSADERQPVVQDKPEKFGPVEELKAAYQSDPRDPEAGATEDRIRGALKEHDEIPAELVRRVSCVKSVCKLEVSWTSDRRHGYMIAMMSLIGYVSQQVAADPVGEHEGQEVHPIDVYVSRVVPASTPADTK